MFYIVALGNPGKEYEKTRHNVGWILADAIREHFNFSEPIFNSTLSGKISQGLIIDEEVNLLYPETFMNNSGKAVVKLVPKDNLDRLIVLHDETALPLGEIKLSVGRGDGGHNGIRSIIAQAGSKDFLRVRVGIAPTSFWTGKVKTVAGERLARFVLGRFSSSEERKLVEVEKKVFEALKVILKEGSTKAMNQFNWIQRDC